MKALSIRQPWCQLILHHGKDIENRTWVTKLRGTIAVHASKTCTEAEYVNGSFALDFVELGRPEKPLCRKEELRRGGFVGLVDIVGCVRESQALWHDEGQWGFMLRNPRPMPFFAYKGRLGFFDAPSELLKFWGIESA